MIGNWAFNWVQRLAHFKTGFFVLWGIVSLLAVAGTVRLEGSLGMASWGILTAALVVIGLLLAWLMDSLRMALLHVLFSLYIVIMTLGLLGWFGQSLDAHTLLGLMVLMTVMTSNLVHVASTLLREMARGLFQYDAVAEALKLNSGPVFLSNATTVLGFGVAAWFEPQLLQVAWVVGIGVAVSYLTTLTLLPAVLLSWLLEFRVGNPVDRYGYQFLVTWLQRYPFAIKALLYALTIGVLWSAYSNETLKALMMEVAWMLGLMVALFVVFWRSLSLALINALANLLALLGSIWLFLFIYPQDSFSLLWLMMPMGLIVDDGIHFFSRYVRAQQNLFAGRDAGVRYAMASVARPIWVSSWVMMAGLAALLLSSQDSVQQAAQITLISVLVATFLILVVVPAFLVCSVKEISGGNTEV